MTTRVMGSGEPHGQTGAVLPSSAISSRRLIAHIGKIARFLPSSFRLKKTLS